MLQLVEGAKQARGLTVIIDVFRAFSMACYVYANGAEKIIPVGKLETAYSLKKENPEFLLIGERDGKKPEGFDYGNSPTEIENIDFSNKTIVQTTGGGTQGTANAKNADEVITGGFVNAQAVIDYIKKKNPKIVSLVSIGSGGVNIADEDELCAEYIKSTLEGKKRDFEGIIEHLRNCIGARKFFDPKKDWAPERDFELCLNLNKFDFVLKVEPYKNNLVSFKKIKLNDF